MSLPALLRRAQGHRLKHLSWIYTASVDAHLQFLASVQLFSDSADVQLLKPADIRYLHLHRLKLFLHLKQPACEDTVLVTDPEEEISQPRAKEVNKILQRSQM